MSRSCSSFVLVGHMMIVAGAAGMARADEPNPKPPASAQPSINRPSQELIGQWIRRLDDEAFTVREAATQRLLKAGESAVPAIIEAISDNELEVTARLIGVLSEMALSKDEATAEAATQALETIAKPKVTAASVRAAEALASLEGVREQRAVDSLRRLGAVLEQHTYGFANGEVDVSFTLEIDKRWKGTNDDIDLIPRVRRIRHIVFDLPAINDDWIDRVAQLSGLTDIILARAQVTTAGLKRLGDINTLQTVQIQYVKIDDEAAEALAKLKGVHFMKLYGTELTEKGSELLAKSMTNTTFDIRRGGFLGIGPSSNLPGCTIGEVQPGTAAEQAGLAPMDVILKYGGKEVTNFQGLVELISDNAPGETVKLVIQRGEKVLKKDVTLGQWPIVDDQ